VFVVGGFAMAGVSQVEGRGATGLSGGAPHKGDNRFQRRLFTVLREVFDLARAEGVSRSEVAALLGLSPRTVTAWLEPGYVFSMPTAAMLFEMAAREDVLPAAARDRLWALLGQEAGYVVAPQLSADLDEAPPAVQGCELAAAVGDVHRALGGALALLGPGGKNLTGEERRVLAGLLDEVVREATEFRVALGGA
jgi:transcriptional regulator with XRE-family HTH domain